MNLNKAIANRIISWFSGEKEVSKSSEPINAIIYDCEIIKCIPTSNYWESEPHDFIYEYCKGWSDFEGMGISVIGAYDYLDDRYHVFLEDNFDHFQRLVDNTEIIIGFNSLSFDDNLCAANGIRVKTTYDLLAEVRITSGQPPHYVRGLTRGGYSLEKLALANFGHGKSGSGELAAEMWQRRKYGAVINYCLHDIQITKKLFDRRAAIKDPTNDEILKLREP